MKVKYFGTMLLRGMMQAKLPVVHIEPANQEHSLLYVLLKDSSKFSIRIGSLEANKDFAFGNEKGVRIRDIYESFARSREYNEMLMKNEYDIAWLEKKISEKEFCRLERHILDYSSKNDEILFKAGFRYAWSLFCECMEKDT